MRRHRRQLSLVQRLLLLQVLIIVGMSATTLLTAALIGPPTFDEHMHRAGHARHPEVIVHAEQAFRAAGSISVGLGLVFAAVGAVIGSTLVTRRITRGLDALSVGADRVARGDFDRPVELPHPDRELERLASTFNSMADRVATVESTRRQLLTDLSHEMRTPLAVIDVTLEAIEDGVTPMDATTIAVLRDQASRLTRLARDIREVSAAEEGRLDLRTAPTPLRTVVQAAADAAHRSFELGGVHLQVEPVSDDTVADIDPARIGQVLDNLLRNALQHCEPGDTVTLAVQSYPSSSVISVRDTGSGIAPQDLPHIFERFYRADRSRRGDATSGTGVGLAISRAIAIAHGGWLTATSDGPGTGATVMLVLPRT